MVWSFLVAGGWVMLPILLCSVLSLALLMERAWFWGLLRLKRDGRLRADLLALRVDRRRVERTRDPICRVLAALIYRPDDPTPALAMADRVVRETKSSLPVIQTLAAVATSLGLLGTVVGVALAFQRSAGSPSTAELAGALSIALNTTIFGLCVYLPTFVGGAVNQMASSRLAFQLEQGLTTLQARIRAQREQQAVTA